MDLTLKDLERFSRAGLPRTASRSVEHFVGRGTGRGSRPASHTFCWLFHGHSHGSWNHVLSVENGRGTHSSTGKVPVVSFVLQSL